MTFEQLAVEQQSGNSSNKYAPPSDYKPRYQHKLEQAPVVPELCDKIQAMVPKTLLGVERLKFIAEQVKKLSQDDRASLQAVIEHFMRYMINAGASDIDAGGSSSLSSVWSRIDGEKKPRLELGRYTTEDMNILVLSILAPDQIDLLMTRCAVDLSYQVMAGEDMGTWHRYRMSVYFDNDAIAMNIRAIANDLRPLASMGFHPTIQNGLMFDHVRDGLTLITGVTGSGKSTTLDAIVDANNSRVTGHIVIIGNPIEYMHMSKQSIVRHREVGRDVLSFHDGVVQALRQDPDIIIIGEMRDPKTISAALEVTDSGHKVFSTLHTSSAIESVARIVAEYPSEEQERVRNRLADVLRCIVSQKLLPRIGGGRVLAKEVLWVTPSARAAIKNNNLEEIYQMMWEGRAQGQHTLEQDLFRLVKQKQIEGHVAVDYANNKKRLQQLAGIL